jgi:dienelactone hydrolase
MHASSVLTRFARLLGACAIAALPAGARAQDRPRGIYSLGSANSLSGLRTTDFVDGFTLRVGWDHLETTPGAYNFSLISSAIAQLQPLGKKLTVEIFSTSPPAYVVAGAGETWNFSTGSTTVQNPVPWDSFAQNAWRNFMQALANFSVADSAQGGALVALSQHPTLAQMDAPVVGLQGIRDLSNTLRGLASYNRSTFVDAVVNSVHSSRDAFAGKFGFLAYFSMTDTQNASNGGQTLDQSLLARLFTEFNSGGSPKLGYFQENLGDSTPTPTGLGKVLLDESARTYTLFQALTSWTNPFTNPSAVASGNPATGISFAYNTYGTTYFELYTGDIDNAAHQDELRQWHATLTGSGGNTAPTITSIANQTVTVGTSTGALGFTVGDAETAAGSLAVVGASSNQTLLPDANILIGGSGANRTITLTPASGQTGTATVTLTVSDGALTASTSFTLTVGGSNTVPTMTALANVSIVQSGTTDPISFTVGDAETPVASLAVTASSSNVALVTTAGIFLNTNPGAAATRYVCVTPQPNLSGTATITLTVTDSGGLTASRSFMVTVRAPAPASLVPKIASTRNGDGSVRLDWNAETGGWYQVEYSADLVAWRAAGTALNTAATSANWTDDGTATGAHPTSVTQRFYRLRPLGVFTVTYNGSTFTYTDADRTITGVWFKPSGAGPFPACIISHGQGGTAASYSADKAGEFLPWGLGSIAPNYAHQANGDTSPIMSGFSPENLARGVACRNILATLPWVDQNRVVLWGHSKGAWLTIGLAGAIADRVVAAGNSAGGILDDSAGVNQAAPTTTQAVPVRAPWIMFHGDGDVTVQPSQSLLFQQLLTSLGVPNQRILYSTTLHNLHQDSTINADMLANYHAWLQTYGVLP